MFPSTYKKASRVYNSTVSFSKHWISTYYPNRNLKFYGVSVEDVQAFSQHYFFSCLLENLPIDNTWAQYPRTTNRVAKEAIKEPANKIRYTIIQFLGRLIFPRTDVHRLVSTDIVILSSGRHLIDLLPLILHLNAKFKVLIVGKMSDDAKKFLKMKKINFLDIPSGTSFIPRWQRLNYLFKFLCKPWKNKHGHKFLNNPYWKNRLMYLRVMQFPEIAALLTLANSLFLHTKPKLLLTSSSNDTFGSAFSLIAKRQKIKVADLQHGFIPFAIDVPFCHRDFFLAWGKIFNNYYFNANEKMVIVGCPSQKKMRAKRLISLKKLKIVKVLVLWAPAFDTGSPFRFQSDAKTLNDLVKGLSQLPPNYQVTIRKHPACKIENRLKELILSKNIYFDSSRNALDAIKSNDIVITQPTSANFIAIMHKKPLLFFNNSWLNLKFGDPLIKSGSAVNVPCSSLSEINKYILKLVTDIALLKKQRNAQTVYFEEYCPYFGKDSWKQIEKIIKTEIKSKDNETHLENI